MNEPENEKAAAGIYLCTAGTDYILNIRSLSVSAGVPDLLYEMGWNESG
jgi:hypothetical protein